MSDCATLSEYRDLLNEGQSLGKERVRGTPKLKFLQLKEAQAGAWPFYMPIVRVPARLADILSRLGFMA